MSLPVRKSCGTVDSVSFLTLASICASPPPPLTCLSSALSPPSLPPSPPSPPSRLDNDGIDLLMSFLKVSLSSSARHGCDVESVATRLAALSGLFLWKEAPRGTSSPTHAVTQR